MRSVPKPMVKYGPADSWWPCGQISERLRLSSGHHVYGSAPPNRPQIKDGVVLTAERVFSIFNSSFNDSQKHALVDYLQACVMFLYNNR